MVKSTLHALVAVLLAAACVVDNPDYVPDPADGGVDGGVHSDGEVGSDGEVDADATMDADETVDSDAEAPFDADVCREHSDCDDGVDCTEDCYDGHSCFNLPRDSECSDEEESCDPDYGCARVLTVDSSCATCSDACSPSAPCSDIEDAIDIVVESDDAGQTVIRIAAGEYTEAPLELDEDDDEGTVHIVGGPAVFWNGNGGDGLKIKGDTRVVLRELQIGGTKTGVKVEENGHAALDRVSIIDSSERGVAAKGNSVARLERCYVAGSKLVGIRVQDSAHLDLENSIIVDNGGPGAAAGGIYFESGSSSGDIRSCTIADNSGDSQAGAILADSDSTLTLSHILFWNNIGSEQPCDGCPSCTSCLDEMVTDPFQEPDGSRSSAGDYQISASSAARDAGSGTPGADLPAVDYWGDPRDDLTVDIGADEYRSP